MSSLQLPILAWLALAGDPSGVFEHRLPDFDLETAGASYVVSLPDDYDSSKSWPVVLDFHGAISPRLKGANLVRERLWSRFTEKAPYIAVGINGRTRAWNMTEGEKGDRPLALAVLAAIRKEYSVDPKRIYLAGFSSGADFLCSGGLQLDGPFAGSLVVCPGPPNVVGLRNGELLKCKDRAFYFATGEEDYIRKNGAWQAFLTLDEAGARVMYREVPGKGHEMFDLDEYMRLFEYLELLAKPDAEVDNVSIARRAIGRKDYLLASTHLLRSQKAEAKQLLREVEARGKDLLKAAEQIDAAAMPGRAFEAWWHIRTQFHRFQPLAERAQAELDQLQQKIDARELYRSRREWLERRRDAPDAKQPAAPARPTPQPAARPPRPPRPWTAPKGVGADPQWTFDRYLTYDELAGRLRNLAQRYPHRAKLLSMGKSIEGRDLWVLEITDYQSGPPATKPAACVQGGLHGNEISSTMTVLYMAYQMAANPGRSRTVAKLAASTTFYAAPAVNPDAVYHYLAEPHSHWRPRFNYRPFDSDGDGRIDEDPYEDLDGDGEIGLMYQPDEDGDYTLEDGRLVRAAGQPRYKLVGREGIDNDDDGKFSEDPPGGVDLNRNFPVGFRARRSFGGSSGISAASEPETKAVVDFIRERPAVSLFLDYHNAAKCLFYWTGTEGETEAPLYEAIAARAQSRLGYTPRRLSHNGAGLTAAWAYGQQGIFALIVELEAGRDESNHDPDNAREGAFLPARPFQHPQLGNILIGNDSKKITKRNPHPRNILWQADRNWLWVREELGQLPRLELRNQKIERTADGFTVVGEIVNSGTLPTDSVVGRRDGRGFPITIKAEGASVCGTTTLEPLAGGEAHPFRIDVSDPAESVALVISHPRAGTARLPIAQPRSPTIPIRKTYEIEPGYVTTDRARLAGNAFYRDGVSSEERGPAFELKHRKSELRIAVLLGEWQDQRHKIDAAEFRRALFSNGDYTGRSATGQHVYGSLRDFYDEMSYGRMAVSGEVFDWVELAGHYADYRDAGFGSRIVSDAMLTAVRDRYAADALDGFDCIAFVWAGTTVKRTSSLWPMRVSLKESPDVVAFKMAEYHLGELSAIGVACHELGHTFGVNDKYGLGATRNPIGPWCLMAKGTHGGEPSGRHRPFHMCAWCKMVIGWVKPAVIDPSDPQKLALRPTLYGPGEVLRILLKPDGSEYLLLENRRREGFQTDLPSPGLVVLKVGPNDLPAAPQTRVQLLPAHGLPPPRRGVLAEVSKVAWPQSGRCELVFAGVRISNIRLVDDVVYLDVSVTDSANR